MVRTRKTKGCKTFIHIVDVRTDKVEAVRKDVLFGLLEIAGLTYEEWRGKDAKMDS